MRRSLLFLSMILASAGVLSAENTVSEKNKSESIQTFAEVAARALQEPEGAVAIAVAQYRADELARNESPLSQKRRSITIPENVRFFRLLEPVSGETVSKILHLDAPPPSSAQIMTEGGSRVFHSTPRFTHRHAWLLFLKPSAAQLDKAAEGLANLKRKKQLNNSNWFKLYDDYSAFPIDYPQKQLKRVDDPGVQGFQEVLEQMESEDKGTVVLPRSVIADLKLLQAQTKAGRLDTTSSAAALQSDYGKAVLAQLLKASPGN